jgi:ribosomal protein S13
MPAATKYYFQDNKTALTDMNAEKVFSTIMAGLQQWSQSTPLSGLGGFVRTVQGDIDYSVINNLSFTSGQLVPLNSFLADITHVVDPTFRRANGYVEGFMKNIPGISKGLEPITNALGEESKRNISDYIMPWSIGTPNQDYEQQYKDVVKQNQLNSEVNYYKRQSDKEMEKTLRAQGIPMTSVAGTGKPTSQKVIEAQKKNVDTLLKSYDEATSDELRTKIRSALETRYGVEFDKAYENYLTKDEQIHQKGLSPTVQKKLERSKEFTYVRKLRDQYDGTGIGGDFLNETMTKRNISQDELDYDDKTLLPDDVQLEQIKNTIDSMGGDELWATLVSMRKISEGSRKSLLTDTLISDLVDEKYLTKDQGKLLKRVFWNEKTGKFDTKEGESDLTKSDLTIKFAVPAAKVAPIGFAGGKGLGQGVGIKLTVPKTANTGTKLKIPTFERTPIKFTQPKASGIKLRTPVRTLSGLGGVK